MTDWVSATTLAFQLAILGKARQGLRLHFLGLAERSRQRLSGARLAFLQDSDSYDDEVGAAEGRGLKFETWQPVASVGSRSAVPAGDGSATNRPKVALPFA